MHLAELVNRAKNTLQKFDLTLNGRNSETKNAKNNPKVPKFLSRAFIDSRKCGRTTLCGCLWVLEVALFGSNMPLGPLGKEKKENLLPQQKWPWGSNFCEPNFQLRAFLALWGRVEWDWHMGMSYLTLHCWTLSFSKIANICQSSVFQVFLS